MKLIIKALKLQLANLNVFIGKRDQLFGDRSEHWKSCNKGIDYLQTTKDYKVQQAELQAVIENLEDLN
tara:strand:+ start:66 stop:269 length:204 start_codon:yes stop_codon:yes gene_type:complete